MADGAEDMGLASGLVYRSLKIPRGWTDADGDTCLALTGNSQLFLVGLRELLNLVKAPRGPT